MLDVSSVSWNPNLPGTENRVVRWHRAISQNPPEFVTHGIITGESRIDMMEQGDFDGDGRSDVASVLYSTLASAGKVRLYRNLGETPVQWKARSISTLLGGIDLAQADIDGDGDMDLLSASQVDGKVAWIENLGGGTLEHGITSQAEHFPGVRSVVAGDLDGDGDPEVIHSSNAVRWHRNQSGVAVSGRILDLSGNGVFLPGESGFLEVTMRSVTSETLTDVLLELTPLTEALALDQSTVPVGTLASFETRTEMIPLMAAPEMGCLRPFGADLRVRWATGSSVNQAGSTIGAIADETLTLSVMGDIPIPDNDPDGLVFTLSVPPRSEETTTSRVELDLRIEHPFVGDISIILTAADGTEVVVKTTSPSDSGNVIDFTRTFGALVGTAPEGDWTVRIADEVTQDTGVISHLGLSVAREFLDCPQWGSDSILRALLGIDPMSSLLDHNGDGVIDVADYVFFLAQ